MELAELSWRCDQLRPASDVCLHKPYAAAIYWLVAEKISNLVTTLTIFCMFICIFVTSAYVGYLELERLHFALANLSTKKGVS